MTDSTYAFIVRTLRTITKPTYRLTLTGNVNILRTEIILTPNHVSQFDPVLLGTNFALVKPIRALAKESLFRAPMIGWVMRTMGHIPVHRGATSASDSLRTAAERIQAGETVAVYPEGTVPEGDLQKLGDFKTGAARLALMTGVPLVPVIQWGTQNILPARTKRSWLKFLKAYFNPVTVTVCVGEPLYPPSAKVTMNPDWEDVILLNEQLKEMMGTMLTQMLDEHPTLTE